MKRIEELKKDHDKLRDIMNHLESLADDAGSLLYPNIRHAFQELSLIWDVHELREEQFFEDLRKGYKEFPHEKMILAHKELRGHWAVLQRYLSVQDDIKVKIAIETDGKMLFDKLRRHLIQEEDHFNQVLLKEAQTI